MVLVKYLPSLLLLQYNFFDVNHCLASILAVGLNTARYIQVNGVKSSYTQPQGLVAQDILTESLQQLYNCYDIAKSEMQVKLVSLQINLLLKSILKFKKGFLKFMKHFYLKTLNFTCNTFFNIIFRLFQNSNVDMRRLLVRL